MKNATCFIYIFCILICVGCAHKPASERSAQELFDEAQKFATKGLVEKASERFMQVRTYYPANELAKKSLLSMADLYYEHEEYDSALNSYEEFSLLYPTDPEASYCFYRTGLCHYQKRASFDRSQDETQKAIQTLEQFLRRYPNSPLADQAKENLKNAKIVMAKHYLYIGKFYLKKHKYEAACNRFSYVKQHYSGLGVDADIDKLITKSCDR